MTIENERSGMVVAFRGTGFQPVFFMLTQAGSLCHVDKFTTSERTTTKTAIAKLILAVAGLLLIPAAWVNGQDAGQNLLSGKSLSVLTRAEWGSINPDEEFGVLQLTIDDLAESVSLPVPFPNITRATLGSAEWPGDGLEFSFNQDASEIKLHLPANLPDSTAFATLETAEESRQFPDGRIVFSALDARVEGSLARLETHPGNHRIGYWSDADDSVHWNYIATRPGRYRLFLTYSVAGEAGSPASEVEIVVGATKLDCKLTATGSWYRYRTVEVGTVGLPRPAEYAVSVRCVEKQGGAVMNLKALTLVPACEGTPPIQSGDQSVLLHAADSTIHGTLLQWEPSEKKRTIGYWANVTDSASWEFTVSHAGNFDVEILQGCGAGAGGSITELAFFTEGNNDPVATLGHTVVDTGHWQAFKPFDIGQVELKPGKYRLRVTASVKAANAVMDLRQVLLRPVRH